LAKTTRTVRKDRIARFGHRGVTMFCKFVELVAALCGLDPSLNCLKNKCMGAGADSFGGLRNTFLLVFRQPNCDCRHLHGI